MLEVANKKSVELDKDSKEVKDIVDNLKTTLTSKEKYVLKQEDKDKLTTYIDSVSKTNDSFKKVQTLSITLNNVDEELKENREKIKVLTENNKVKDKEIKELKEENHSLRDTLEFWEDKFLRVISLVKNKLFSREKEREKYMDVLEDLYKNGIIKTDTFEDLKDTYLFSKEHDSKEKDRDDFDIEI